MFVLGTFCQINIESRRQTGEPAGEHNGTTNALRWVLKNRNGNDAIVTTTATADLPVVTSDCTVWVWVAPDHEIDCCNPAVNDFELDVQTTLTTNYVDGLKRLCRC